MSRTLTILCAGAYGIRNAGDDLPLVCLKEGLADLLPGTTLEFRVLSRHPDPWEEAAYGVTMVKNLEHDSGQQARGRKFLGFNEGDDPAHLERVKQEIARCDLLVLGAGNALLDLTIGDMRGPVPLMALYGSLASQARKPVMLYGMSVGPLRTTMGRHLTEGLLRTAAVISVRDLDSARLCRELLGGIPTKPDDRQPFIHVLPDATLATKNPGPRRALQVLAEEGISLPENRPVMALGLRDLTRVCGPDIQQRTESALLGMMNNLKNKVTFLFIPQSTYSEDDDRLLAQRLVEATSPETECRVIQQRHHPRDLVALYGLARATLSIRLHAAVFSAIAGAPVVGINYLPKVGGFLDQLGVGTQALELENVTAESLITLMQRLLATTPDEGLALAERVAELRVRARVYPLLALTKGLRLSVGGTPQADKEL